MARKPRIEIKGGLYHVITRGNNRRRIFRSADDYRRFTDILTVQKEKLPFYLYAYCLMPNHLHLLIEMGENPISRIMQRVLTTYSQYHNRKYKKVGHLFQGRYKGILCESDRYLGELVRYIHLNPVRAKIVERPEQYEYSGHRAYIGEDKSQLVDSEPVLRHFGGTRRRAMEVYKRFVDAGLGQKRQEEYYRAAEGRLLGSDEFADQVKHRVGEVSGRRSGFKRGLGVEGLLRAAAKASGLKKSEFCGNSKNRSLVKVREAIIIVGREMGIANRELAEALGIDASAATKRAEAGRARAAKIGELRKLRKVLKSSA